MSFILSFVARAGAALLLITAPAMPAFASQINAPSMGSDAGTSVTAGTLVIKDAWIRATPGGAKVAGGFMTITNRGNSPDRLIGGALPVAGRVEIHEMAMSDGVMRMRALPQGLEIAPGAHVELKPGSYHVMFMDLKGGLREGETIKGEIVFEKAGRVEILYRIAPIGGKEAPGGHSSH